MVCSSRLIFHGRDTQTGSEEPKVSQLVFEESLFRCLLFNRSALLRSAGEKRNIEESASFYFFPFDGISLSAAVFYLRLVSGVTNPERDQIKSLFTPAANIHLVRSGYKSSVLNASPVTTCDAHARFCQEFCTAGSLT